MKTCDIELRCGDSETVMAEYPDGFFDCALTSPPFQNLRAGVAEYHSVFDFNLISQHLHRLVKENGGCLIWQIGAEVRHGIKSTVPEENLLAFKALNFNYHDDILYLKSSLPFHSPTHARHANCYEHCYVMYRGKKIGAINIISDRPNSTGGRIEGNKVRPMFSDRTNGWLIHSGHNKSTLDDICYADGSRFSAVMPERLTENLITTFTNKNDRLIDCFGGVFSSAKMSILAHRKCVCVEKSLATFSVGVRRLESMDLEGLGLVKVKSELDMVGWNYTR